MKTKFKKRCNHIIGLGLTAVLISCSSETLEEKAMIASMNNSVVESQAPQTTPTFSITITRTLNIGDSLITGNISVNNESIGKTYENKDSLVKAGSYKGLMRYYSGKGFTTGPFGTIGKKGDFLIEIDKAPSMYGRIKSDVLLHTGFLPKHSKGCVLLGLVSGPKSARFIADEHALKKLRLKFYGTETPASCPNMNIVIQIVDKLN